MRHLVDKLERAITEERAVESSPPQGAIGIGAADRSPPAEPAASGQPVPGAPTLAASTAVPPKKPLYKRWYLWVPLVGVVLIGASVGLAVAYTTPNNAAYPTGTFNISFH